MALDAAEEENIEAVKRWWEDNGRMLSTIVIVVALGWGGWTLWNNSRDATMSAASDLYEEILALAIVDPETEATEADRASIAAAAQLLKDEYPNTIICFIWRPCLQPNRQWRADNLDAAKSELEWVLNNAGGSMFSDSDPGIRLAASLRLGRILLAQGDTQAALDLVEGHRPTGIRSRFCRIARRYLCCHGAYNRCTGCLHHGDSDRFHQYLSAHETG